MTESAGNFSKNCVLVFTAQNWIGSSETIRAACSSYALNILSFYPPYDSQKNHNTIQDSLFFSYWLTGFIDLCGWFGVSKKAQPSLSITVGEKQLALFSRIENNLGGSISPKKNGAVYRWRLHNLPVVKKGVNLIHRKRFLPKRQERFQNGWNALGKSIDQREQNQKRIERSKPDLFAPFASKQREVLLLPGKNKIQWLSIGSQTQPLHSLEGSGSSLPIQSKTKRMRFFFSSEENGLSRSSLVRLRILLLACCSFWEKSFVRISKNSHFCSFLL